MWCEVSSVLEMDKNFEIKAHTVNDCIYDKIKTVILCGEKENKKENRLF